jgi:predicted RNase H-like HicB family nuclease
MKKLSLAATIWDEDGMYVSKSPETGVASCGDTPEEALCNLLEAVELYLENAKELGMLEDLNAALNLAINSQPK